jgi:membrane protease YdiL (CAAX protease family)
MAAMVHLLMQPLTNGRPGRLIEARVAVESHTPSATSISWASDAAGSPDNTECQVVGQRQEPRSVDAKDGEAASWILCRMTFRTRPYPVDGFDPIKFIERERGWRVVETANPTWSSTPLPWRVDWTAFALSSTLLLALGFAAYGSLLRTGNNSERNTEKKAWLLLAAYAGILILGVLLQNRIFGSLVYPGPRESTHQFLLIALVLAPIIEELFYRGWMLALLRSAWGDTPALLISSGLFAVVHAWSETAILYAFSVAYLLGLVFIKTKSILSCIVLHAALNLLPLIALLVRQV